MHRQLLSATGFPLGIETTQEQGRLRISMSLQAPADCTLHWGVSPRPGAAWRCPPPDWWPSHTVPVGEAAARTPFSGSNGERKLTIELEPPATKQHLVFVLHLPAENRWVRNGNGDFIIPLPRGQGVSPAEALTRRHPEAKEVCHTFTLDNGTELAAAVWPTKDGYRVCLVCDADGSVQLHWGVAERTRHEWKLPPESCRPAGTEQVAEQAVRSSFQQHDGLYWLEWVVPNQTPPRWLRFVLYQPATGEWLKLQGSDLCLALREEVSKSGALSGPLEDIAERIIEAEVGSPSWTLMHRFHLCHDLLGRVEDDPDGLALHFAWLRYSAMRQLDWQRSYNTKPRELSHAQDRLTMRITGIYRRYPPGSSGRRWAHMLLATLGRGGEGQRVRDEILQIMHRNHIKEHANFIEEWHQKLHNNTTPDDVVICEAYLAFLNHDGDLEVFYKTLEQGGVTRERLLSYERPIRTAPEFLADRKDALIREFSDYLGILKALHSGADLETAAKAARPLLDEPTNRHLSHLFDKGAPVPQRTGQIISLRESLGKLIERTADLRATRDLLFLDLALEHSLRNEIERLSLDSVGWNDLLQLTTAALRNIVQSTTDEELVAIDRQWQAFLGDPAGGQEKALQALSLSERLGRWVQTFTDELYHRLQPRAEYLGEGFGVERWVIELFSEEIIRGGPVFALSRVLHRFASLARHEAGVGPWQVISPASVRGRVFVVPNLLTVQAERYAEATVLIVDEVSGEEEIPEGVTAVLTRSQPDLVSHVAVRARNSGVLFATCFDAATFAELQELKDKYLALDVVGGKVEYHESSRSLQKDGREQPAQVVVAGRPRPGPITNWVLTAEAFTPDVVGGKSNNLNGLRGRLPEWIRTPTSIALPFGAFESALQGVDNQHIRDRYEQLISALESDPSAKLAELRSTVMEMNAPNELRQALEETWQQVGLPATSWEQIWRGITRVWASKWTDRAYFSRRSRGVPHDSVWMAVLIQEVVPADLAFVIHTVHPVSRDRDELFAEVVLGLGETLVANYPGQALGFVCRKSDLSVRMVSYPSKSVGLDGKGVIFRSDSNGEDLEGFAGAGLYESVLAEDPSQRRLDYASEPILRDVKYRQEVLLGIGWIGIEVERLVGAPQDIEGAVHDGRYYIVQTRPQVGL